MDLTTLLIAAILVLVLAGVLIALFFALRGGQNTSAPQKQSTAHPELVEVAHLGRDKTTNMLVVVMDGKLISRGAELSMNQRHRLSAAMDDLHKLLGQPAAAAPLSPAQPAVDVRTPPPPAQAFSAPLGGDVQSPVEVKPISTNPVDAIRRSLGPSTPTPSFKSIPAQIEEILQGLLVGSPLEKQGIHLSESLTEGVIVQVGLDQYPGIDAVPDEQVRNIIRAAVAEWEKRNRPK